MKARTQKLPRPVNRLSCKHDLVLSTDCANSNASRLEVGKSWPIPTSHTKRAAAPALESLGLRPETPRLFSYQHENHVAPTHNTQHSIPRACTTMPLLLVSLSKRFAMHTRVHNPSKLSSSPRVYNIQK
jgi:hypothetical protein